MLNKSTDKRDQYEMNVQKTETILGKFEDMFGKPI